MRKLEGWGYINGCPIRPRTHFLFGNNKLSIVKGEHADLLATLWVNYSGPLSFGPVFRSHWSRGTLFRGRPVLYTACFSTADYRGLTLRFTQDVVTRCGWSPSHRYRQNG